MIDDTDPFIELPQPYGEDSVIYIRRSRVVMLEKDQLYREGGFLQGTTISFRLTGQMTTRFIPLPPQEVMARLDRTIE